MTLWLDAHLPPSLAPWLSEAFDEVEAYSALYLDLLCTPDAVIFEQAAEAGAVVVTKDVDFARLVVERGAPPQVVWLRCGNTSSAALRTLLTAMLPDALAALRDGHPLIEIRGR